MYFASLIVFTILLVHSGPSQAQDKYDGHYDLRARDAAFLCTLMEDYVKTGKQPSLTDKTPADQLDKQTFTNGKPCYKFSWKPCDAATYAHTSQRPCGWYQMESENESEC